MPTIFCAVSGKRSSIASPKNVPEPTDVRPTTKPHAAPITIATNRSRGRRMNGASSACPCRNVFARKPRPPRMSAPPTILPIVASVSSPKLLAICTPTSDSGAEPTSIQSASRA